MSIHLRSLFILVEVHALELPLVVLVECVHVGLQQGVVLHHVHTVGRLEGVVPLCVAIPSDPLGEVAEVGVDIVTVLACN